MRILVLEHEPDAPAQLFAEWARTRGHELTIAPVPDLERWPDPRDYDAIVSLGSDTSVHAEPHAWVQPELRLLRSAHEHDIPLLGICFGGQALAKALGGEVRMAQQAEVCWAPIETSDPQLVMAGPWFCWHADEFGMPPGARLISGTERQTMAFAAGRSLALQYHPEVDAELALAWIDGGRAKLAVLGVDSERLREQVSAHAAGARERAFEQFDRIEEWWAVSSSLEHVHRGHKETR